MAHMCTNAVLRATKETKHFGLFDSYIMAVAWCTYAMMLHTTTHTIEIITVFAKIVEIFLDEMNIIPCSEEVKKTVDV